jgi:hypothetical protein
LTRGYLRPAWIGQELPVVSAIRRTFNRPLGPENEPPSRSRDDRKELPFIGALHRL